MGKPLERPRDPDLYEADFYAWTQEQAARLRARTHNDVDWDNLAEEIESVGLRELRAIEDWYAQMAEFLLLWQLRPQERCHSWQSKISEARIFLEGIFKASPSLCDKAGECLKVGYADALLQIELRKPELVAELPPECPWSVEQLADYAFMPGPPWSPEDLLLD